MRALAHFTRALFLVGATMALDRKLEACYYNSGAGAYP